MAAPYIILPRLPTPRALPFLHKKPIHRPMHHALRPFYLPIHQLFVQRQGRGQVGVGFQVEPPVAHFPGHSLHVLCQPPSQAAALGRCRVVHDFNFDQKTQQSRRVITPSKA